jgi:hypothetical protein
MRKTRPQVLVAAGSVMAVLVTVSVAYANPAVVRYASPSGKSTNPCTQPQPCDIVTAINDAPNGATVLLQSGRYGSAKHPITTELQTTNSLTVDGGSVAHPASIFSAAPDTALLLNGQENELTDVVIHSSASTGGLYLGVGLAEHVSVYADGGVYGACSVYGGDLVDAVCSETAAGEPAIGMNDSGAGTVTSALKAVTAVATGSDSVGLGVAGENGIDFEVAVTDSVIRGTAHDLEVSANSAASTTVTIDHSDFRPSTTSKEGISPTTVNSNHTDVTGAPRFLNAATGNFRERPGSPTVDAGAPFIQDPKTDLAGDPRLLGKAQDIGAYEFLPRPLVKRPSVAGLGAHRVRTRITVNPERLPTKVRLVAVHDGRKAIGRPISAGSGPADKKLRLTLGGLKAQTRYVVYVVAVNKGGTTKSKRRIVHTKA